MPRGASFSNFKIWLVPPRKLEHDIFIEKWDMLKPASKVLASKANSVFVDINITDLNPKKFEICHPFSLG